MPKGHRGVGNYVGATGTAANGGVFSLRSAQLLASANLWGSIVTPGLVLQLEAFNPASYSGTGTAWNDLSGAGNHFTLTNAAAFNSSGPKYMDFNGSYGAAYRATDIALANTVTYMVWTRVKNSTADWRTLTRANAGTGNHHVIITAGGWDIGMYNNSGTNSPSANNTSGYLQTSLPNHGTSNWICMYWRFNTSSPYYRMSYNDTPGTIRANITTSGAQYGGTGFGTLGAYNYAAPSQYWGDISAFYAYNRILTDAELMQNFNQTRGRFGL
jgi:hypothetical protein